MKWVINAFPASQCTRVFCSGPRVLFTSSDNTVNRANCILRIYRVQSVAIYVS